MLKISICLSYRLYRREKMKKVIGVYRNQHMHWVGDGFPVKNLFSYARLGQAISPFLLLDYAAPYHFDPATVQRGVGSHPHRGFETVTLAYQGEVTHQDSSGGGGTIQARSEEHTSELQSRENLVCRLLLE